MTLNQKEMTLELTRIEVCDLMLACGLLGNPNFDNKWDRLHDKLREMIDEFDKENGYGA